MAREQLLAAVEAIRSKNKVAATRFRDRVKESLGRLKRFPESGTLVAEFPELPYREVFVAPYRFFYRVQGKTVWVVAVWHGAQIPGDPSDA
jgi:plasmid stabilization system protein ParE